MLHGVSQLHRNSNLRIGGKSVMSKNATVGKRVVVWSISSIFVILGACIPPTASANVVPINVHKKPEYFVKTMINSNMVEDEFLTCLARIRASHSFNDPSCVYTFRKFNIILARLDYGQIQADETALFRSILEMISQQSMQKSGANR